VKSTLNLRGQSRNRKMNRKKRLKTKGFSINMRTDSAEKFARAFDVRDWRAGECDFGDHKFKGNLFCRAPLPNCRIPASVKN
jgi:hypothetical protein